MNLQTFFPPLWEEFSSLITGRLSDNYQCWVNRSPSFPTLGHPGGCHESIHLCHTPGLQWQMSLWPFFFGSCLGSFLSVDLTRSGPAVLISHCVDFAGSALGAPEDGCLHHLFRSAQGTCKSIAHARGGLSLGGSKHASDAMETQWLFHRKIFILLQFSFPSCTSSIWGYFSFASWYWVCWWWMLLLFVSFLSCPQISVFHHCFGRIFSMSRGSRFLFWQIGRHTMVWSPLWLWRIQSIVSMASLKAISFSPFKILSYSNLIN